MSDLNEKQPSTMPINGLTITYPPSTATAASPTGRKVSATSTIILPSIEDNTDSLSATPTLTPSRSYEASDAHAYEKQLSERPSEREPYSERETSPFSAFYSHPTTKYSLEANRSASVSKQNLSATALPYDSDLEAGFTSTDTPRLGQLNHTNTFASNKDQRVSDRFSKLPTTQSKDNCPVWPGRRAQLQKHSALKASHRHRHRGCWGRWWAEHDPLRNLDKRTRVWVKVLIVLVVLGVAVGVGIGISKAVGGGVWNGGGGGVKPIS